MTTRARARAVAAGLDPDELMQLIHVALDEDLRYGPDVTTEATVPVTAQGTADIVARRAGVIAGLPVALGILAAAGVEDAVVEEVATDGDHVRPGQVVLTVTASLRGLLTAERTMLNFLTHLSGVATATDLWCRALAGTHCRVRDTRKTLPGLRQLEKYAVRVGGGVNHRMGLGDAALVKDNHVAAAGSMTDAVIAIGELVGERPIEIECDTTSQVAEALRAGARIVLLDNMNLAEIAESVSLAREIGGAVLEVSGGVELARAAKIAATGVDFISVGALTHSAPALDLGMDLRAQLSSGRHP
jgi:nicotinate-nucleotide pyrophosphorylase (carboxylating)